MKPYLVIPLIAAIILLGCTQIQQYIQTGNQTNQTCAQQNQLCGYGTASPASLSVNQTFYGKCCEGYACAEGYCEKPSEKCVGNGQLCAYGPVNLAHPDNLVYYGECCDGECVNGYCKPQCKTSGSCGNASDCCSGFECKEGQCRQPCKTSGSCSSNLDCCSGYYCDQSMQCTKPCQTSGNCSVNSDCCSGYFCSQNSTCTPEPKCVAYRMPCTNSSQCCSNFTCINGICANSSCNWGTACNSTSDCCPGLYCGQSGVCNAQSCMEIGDWCNSTNDCCLNRKCENNICVNRTCASLNETCTSLGCCEGLTCMNSICQSPCKISGVCLKDSDCCYDYYCSPAGYCLKTPTCTLESGSCVNDSQCCPHLMCNGGICTKPCKKTGTCNSNSECCAGYLCDATFQCSPQSTCKTSGSCTSNSDCCTSYKCYQGSCYSALCEQQCLAAGYTDWFCDPAATCGYAGTHLSTGDSGCPTRYEDWSYPGYDYCCCNNALPAAVWYCCASDSQYSCYQNSCPPLYQQVSGPYSQQADCLEECSLPAGECSVGTPQCASECQMAYGNSDSICSYGACPTGYIQAPQDTSCSDNPPCDRCCCNQAGTYTEQSCLAWATSQGFTHSLLTQNGTAWSFDDCYNAAQLHCQQFHNGATAPSGTMGSNCCVWLCSDESGPGPN